ncbi:MAG: hypothetical protein QM765_04185 [Myxococcales bacterium]
MVRVAVAAALAMGLAVGARAALRGWVGDVWAEYVALLVVGASLSLAGAWAGRGERRAMEAGTPDAHSPLTRERASA